jgi:hypothetical protein
MSDTIIELETIARRAEVSAELEAWLDGQGDEVRAAANAWFALALEQGKDVHLVFEERADSRGPIFVVDCQHGHHESRTSFAAALTDLIEAHKK